MPFLSRTLGSHAPWILGGVLALVATCCAWASALAQEAAFSSRPLASGHWSYAFAEILHARGEPRAWPVWLEPLPAAALYPSMEEAGRNAARPNAAAEAWAEALRSEAALGPRQWARIGLSAGFESSEVSLLPERGGYVEGVSEIQLSPTVAFWAEGGFDTESSAGQLISGGLAAHFGAAQLLVGRLSPSIGQGTSTILLAGRKAMDGAMLGTARPFRLPLLGRTTAHVFVTPNISTPTVDNAWFSSFGVSIEPHSAVTLGAYRTVRFAGEGLSDGVGEALWSVFPFQGGDNPAEDNQGELAARVRFTAWGQPLATYVSLGFEDPPSIWEDPGIVAGVLIPFDVRSGVLTTRYEYHAFGEKARWCGSCPGGSHQWYRQREYGRYEIENVLIGSSLGGYGSRHSGEISYWGASQIRLAAVLFVEHREERNLLFERWPGSRVGFALSTFVRPRPGWEVGFQAVAADSDEGAEGGFDFVFRVFDVVRNAAGGGR